MTSAAGRSAGLAIFADLVLCSSQVWGPEIEVEAPRIDPCALNTHFLTSARRCCTTLLLHAGHAGVLTSSQAGQVVQVWNDSHSIFVMKSGI